MGPSPSSSATQPAASSPPAPGRGHNLPHPPSSSTSTTSQQRRPTLAEAKLIGSGGYGRVFVAEKLPSLPASAVPEKLRHLPYAVKRAKSGAHKLDDLCSAR